MPSSKSDESFLEKLAIGATGTTCVHRDPTCLGHHAWLQADGRRMRTGQLTWKVLASWVNGLEEY